MWEVIDMIYREDEMMNPVFVAETKEECEEWVANQPDSFTYKITFK